METAPELQIDGHTHSYAQNGTVDFKGEPALKKKTGKWTGAIPMIVIQIAATVIFFGIVSNLITYLTGVLHRDVARSASDANNLQGTYFLSSVLGAFLSDTYWGRYKTLVFSFILYSVGLTCLTVSASVKSLRPPSCPAQDFTCEDATPGQTAFFFLSLYAIAFAGGSATTSFVSFGADQFDEADDAERLQRYTFFNCIVWGINFGGVISVTLLVYVEDHVGFSWGFGLLGVVLAVAIVLFLVQTPRYRYRQPEGSPLKKVVQVLVAAFRKRKISLSSSLELHEEESIIKGKRTIPHTDQFLFIDKAAMKLDKESNSTSKTNPWKLSTVTRVEEVKLVIRMLPIWFATLWLSTAPSQASTFFLRQGMSMDNRFGSSSFKVPPASMLVFSNISIILFLPLYDRLLVPAMRKFTKNERGLTLLQRTGAGIFVSVIALAVATAIEIKRKDWTMDPSAASSKVPIFWLVPQYVLLGIAEGLANTSFLEFFYDQAPDTFHSLGTSLALANLGVGSFLSSELVSAVNRAAPSWLQNDVNAAHLERFYGLLAALSVVNLGIYLLASRWYSYKKPDPYPEEP